MPAIYVHEGDTVDHIPSTDLPCGSVVVLGGIVGITTRPIVANALGSLAITGVWDLPSVGVPAPAWAPAYWLPAAGQVTADGSAPGAIPLGLLVRNLAAGDAFARVLLNR
jgi:predicted RecA/RadA family phage recombinase